jgi:hypothetical protein
MLFDFLLLLSFSIFHSKIMGQLPAIVYSKKYKLAIVILFLYRSLSNIYKLQLLNFWNDVLHLTFRHHIGEVQL